ncbi:MAG: hypothetical protein LUG65_01230 [Clostridiales bacterium]|nr:hypothetical protein [Clostridiales bacterium]
MLEKIYHKVMSAGVSSIVCGIISIAVGVSTGVILIVSGAKLLASKKDMEI